MRDAGDLLEWAEVHGNLYGTPPRTSVEKVLAQGRDILFDIDYQGTRQVKQKTADEVVTVFILPPSMMELRARLERRAEDSPRSSPNAWTMPGMKSRAGRNIDYVSVNGDLQSTFNDLRAILTAERRRALRQKPGIGAFIEKLLRET